MAGWRPVSPERRCGGFRSHDIGLFAIYRRDLFGVLLLAEFPAFNANNFGESLFQLRFAVRDRVGDCDPHAGHGLVVGQ
jgi:hypothetical protein